MTFGKITPRFLVSPVVPRAGTGRSIWTALIGMLLLQGCAPLDTRPGVDQALLREGLSGTGAQRPAVATASGTEMPAREEDRSAPNGRGEWVEGSGEFIQAPPAVTQSGPAAGGGYSFNFENLPIQAVINSVLGDMLHENYSIAQGVDGQVTFSTSRPVDEAQAVSILESLLSWTGNAMIRDGERYVILPADRAVPGNVVPSLPMEAPQIGLSARLFVLRYISAHEMLELLEPFARENAFLLVDSNRNLLAMSGTAAELDNYQRTIDTFDVNWLKGMSIGVFDLQRANIEELMPELDRLFGPQGDTPLAGMLRFIPIQRTNAVVVISPQAEYLREVRKWIELIDRGGGNEPRMYVYDVRNMKATDLAVYLRQIYDDAPITESPTASVAPGLRTTTLTGNGLGSIGSLGGGESAMGESSEASDTDADWVSGGDETDGASHAASSSSYSGGDTESGVRISAQKSSNQLLIRCRPSEWEEIRSAIQRLDNPPLQVQIETRILEVSLVDELSYGVQWFLGRLAGNSTASGIADRSGHQGALGQGGAGFGGTESLFYSFLGHDLQVALRALESKGNTQVLSEPSLVVMNNQRAQIQVGDNIPITQTSINPSSTDLNVVSNVQYVQTGVILDVTPRINPGGLVYLDIEQQVSNASATVDAAGNPTISTRAIATQVAVQSGQTILLGGLIQHNNSLQDDHLPGISKVPGIRWLFGSRERRNNRSELIVLITPRVVTNDREAQQVTDDYRRRFRLLQPIEAPSEA